ncbi:MAG: 4-hydroxy-tetrahydrodipicolinate synthase [Bacteroidales bacterium]|jgi:4-hydroxy-tetrahydrodipicolinate synthase|nr:4-hydroxy-tetrahydrodipicolinate synthase [Bacteroidales bacterium]
MINSKFFGAGVALTTPFHKYGTVDFTSLGNLIDHVVEGGIDYIVALGTTSETATLTEDERKALLDFIIDRVNKRLPIVVGLGGNNTQLLVETIKHFDFEGIDAILSVTPYYNKPNQKGLYYHYKALSSVSPLPIILYNVPSRTAVNMSAETTLKLAHEFKNIIAIKEASGNMIQIMNIIKDKPKNFLVISGDDTLTDSMVALGGAGVISVTANAYPSEFHHLVKAGLNKNFEEAHKINNSLLEFMEAIFEDGNPAGIKAALSVMGIMKNNLRLPLVKTNVPTFNKIKAFVDGYKSPLKK